MQRCISSLISKSRHTNLLVGQLFCWHPTVRPQGILYNDDDSDDVTTMMMMLMMMMMMMMKMMMKLKLMMMMMMLMVKLMMMMMMIVMMMMMMMMMLVVLLTSHLRRMPGGQSLRSRQASGWKRHAGGCCSYRNAAPLSTLLLPRRMSRSLECGHSLQKALTSSSLAILAT